MIIRLWQADFLDYSYHRHILRFTDFQQKRFFLVPKPRLGNALAGEARLPVTGDGPKPGLRAQTRSQAGAWERGKPFYKKRRLCRRAV